MANKQTWYVYILECVDNSLYTGITVDVDRRLNEHNHDNKLAAKYTRVRRPVKLVYQEIFTTRSEASQREAKIKKLKRKEKAILIKEH